MSTQVNQTETKTSKVTAILNKKEATESEIKYLIDNMKDQLSKALPQYMTSEKFTRIVITTFSRNPDLFKCTPQSVLGAVMTAAQIGLDPDLGLVHLIPFNSKVNGSWMKLCQLVIDYKGYLQLIMNSGQVKDAYAEIIYSNDIFEETLGTERQLIHKKPKLGTDRGEPIAYYAVISLINGGRLYKLMTKDEVREHAKKYSKQKNKESGELNNLWSEKASGEFDKMGLKTVIRQIAKYAPKSTELVRSIDRDGTITEKLNTDMIYNTKKIEMIREPFGSTMSPAVGSTDMYNELFADENEYIDVKTEEKSPEVIGEKAE